MRLAHHGHLLQSPWRDRRVENHCYDGYFVVRETGDRHGRSKLGERSDSTAVSRLVRSGEH
jgi:hypothetical protein